MWRDLFANLKASHRGAGACWDSLLDGGTGRCPFLDSPSTLLVPASACSYRILPLSH